MYSIYYRNECELPCGLSSENEQSLAYKLPNKRDFDYQYTTALQPPRTYNTIRRDDHIFIDPRTGLMFNANSIKRGDVSGTRDLHNDCYQPTSVASASHIYDRPNYDVESLHEDEDYVHETKTSTLTIDYNTDHV